MLKHFQEKPGDKAKESSEESDKSSPSSDTAPAPKEPSRPTTPPDKKVSPTPPDKNDPPDKSPSNSRSLKHQFKRSPTLAIEDVEPETGFPPGRRGAQLKALSALLPHIRDRRLVKELHGIIRTSGSEKADCPWEMSFEKWDWSVDACFDDGGAKKFKKKGWFDPG